MFDAEIPSNAVTPSGVGGSAACEVAELLASGNFFLNVVLHSDAILAAGCVEFWPFAAGYHSYSGAICCPGVVLDAYGFNDWLIGDWSWVVFGCNWVLLLLDPVLLLMHPDVCIAGVGVWCVAVGFCFYVKVSFLLLLLCSTADDGDAGLGAGAFCCRALPCHCVNYHRMQSKPVNVQAANKIGNGGTRTCHDSKPNRQQFHNGTYNATTAKPNQP
ncbi:hypothetical protein Nepgr_033762 [Nepenthes gracilis]|uniref:Uncharacterized protein n=1 Tax=Nepenthes gracilis TaxID=150966 RepID=A0AAD3Y766_NEPGR|nr:hypothetical protein Nepgr_033762 [Nepenthes gracilis]